MTIVLWCIYIYFTFFLYHPPLLFAIVASYSQSYVSPSSYYRFNLPNPSFYLHLLHPFLYIHEYFPIHRMIVAFITCPFYILVDCFWSDPTSLFAHISSNRTLYTGCCCQLKTRCCTTTVPRRDMTILRSFPILRYDCSPYQDMYGTPRQSNKHLRRGLLDRAAEDVVISHRCRRRSGTWGGEETSTMAMATAFNCILSAWLVTSCRYYTVLFDEINGSANTLFNIFPTIWSPRSFATCPPAITYHANVAFVVVGVVTHTTQRSIFLCASVWCGTFFVCRAHKKWKTMTYLQIWYVRKTKKMCEQGQYLREKREKPKKCVKYVFMCMF